MDDPEVLARVRELAIPPAWKDVWICADPWGHLQATGIDAAGRKQYLYHPRWRERRDREKFERMLRFGERLPGLRKRLAKAMKGEEPTRELVLAAAVRLLDVGLFRIGSEQYAEDDHGVGLATVRKDHVALNGRKIVFDYPAKAGIRRVQEIEDPLSLSLVARLKRRRGGEEQLLAYRQGRSWAPLRSDEINEFIKAELGEEFSAKDFRTWNATVLAAVSVAAKTAASEKAPTKSSRKRTIDAAVRDVSEMLGNTPAVARRSYIDPRVFDRYLSGWTIADDVVREATSGGVDDRRRARLEQAVLDLLTDATASPVVEKLAA